LAQLVQLLGSETRGSGKDIQKLIRTDRAGFIRKARNIDQFKSTRMVITKMCAAVGTKQAGEYLPPDAAAGKGLPQARND
jgi:hypothetical protein